MGFLKSSLFVMLCLMLSVFTLSAMGQGVKGIALSGSVAATTFPGQEFHCHTGYSLAQCQRDLLQLKNVLTHYPIQGLGHWTWVLVRSQDWKPISQMLGLNPDSPAFTAVEPRETFLEEALFAHDPQRSSELMDQWRMSMPDLLQLAVSHELGHALCGEPNEAVADHIGDELRHGRWTPCPLSKKAKGKSIEFGSGGHKLNALKTP